MKKFILAVTLVLSGLAFAEDEAPIFPQVFNYGNSVQIQITNHTDSYVTCSGPVWITTDKGATYSEHYFDSVMPRFTSYRRIQVRNFQDRIRFVNHSIFCR